MKVGEFELHPSVTVERVMEGARVSMFGASGYPGFCVKCGEEADGVEPDARKYRCGGCGALAVYGAEELLFYVT